MLMSRSKQCKTLLNPLVVTLMIILTVLSYDYFDRYLLSYFAQLNLREQYPLLVWISYFGSSLVYLFLLIGFALFFRWIYPEKQWAARFWFLWLSVAVSNAICTVLKMGLGRARPELMIQSHEYGFYGFKTTREYWSFPSGHTTTIMSLGLGLSVLFPRYRTLFIFFAAVVAFSRIVLLQHYLSDVLVASYLAVVEVMLLVCYLRKNNYLTQAF